MVKAELYYGDRASQQIAANLAILERFFEPFESFIFYTTVGIARQIPTLLLGLNLTALVVIPLRITPQAGVLTEPVPLPDLLGKRVSRAPPTSE